MLPTARPSAAASVAAAAAAARGGGRGSSARTALLALVALGAAAAMTSTILSSNAAARARDDALAAQVAALAADVATARAAAERGADAAAAAVATAASAAAQGAAASAVAASKDAMTAACGSAAAAAAATAAGAAARELGGGVAVAVPPPLAPPAAAAGAAAAPGPAGGQPARYALIGMASSVGIEELHVYVRSARVHMPPGAVDIVLFVDPATAASPAASWLFAAFSVTAIRFTVEDFPPAVRKYHPSSYRWLLIRDWLADAAAAAGYAPGAGRPPPYTAVFFTDVRDAVWQGNVFAANAARNDGLTVWLEARTNRIRGCGWNSKWVKDCFGEDGLARVGGEWISCSGTVAGGWDAATVYASAVGDYLEAHPGCEGNGIDQGVHNYFVHAGVLREKLGAALPLYVAENMDVVATIQAMPLVRLDAAGRVVGDAPAGGGAPPVVPPLVHQYDRVQEIAAAAKRQFPHVEGGKVFDRRG
jgi:hypothetical protein